MRVFKKMYAFQVENAIADGKRVRILDREAEQIYNASTMQAQCLIGIVRSDDEQRYEFWSVEESEDSNEQ